MEQKKYIHKQDNTSIPHTRIQKQTLMHQKPEKKQILQRDDDLFRKHQKRGNQMPPSEEKPTAPPPANIHASPPPSHRPTPTAPQTPNSATVWLELWHARLLHPAAAHTSGGGARKTEERVSFRVFKNEIRKRFKREAKPACCEGRRPQVVFGNTLRPLGTTGSKGGVNFCWRFLSNNSVVLCPDKVAVFHFCDKFLHYHFLGPTIAAGNGESVSS